MDGHKVCTQFRLPKDKTSDVVRVFCVENMGGLFAKALNECNLCHLLQHPDADVSAGALKL